MKKAGYLLLLFLILYATSCSDMNEVKSSGQGVNKNDIIPMKTLRVDDNTYVIGWQLEVKDGTNYRWVNKQSVTKENDRIQKESDSIEKESDEVVKTPADSERDDTTETSINSENTEESKPEVAQRKIKGYQATRDLKTGEIITYPVYEDEQKQ